MEYVQLTFEDWEQIKEKLKKELLGVKQSFVRIGYALRQIDDQKLYEKDGYKSVAEFAKAEYGLEPSTTSRFMSINREYSLGGYSENLDPKYADLGRSQLEEMLKLPIDDRKMIQPETSREDIRELKRFNKSAPAAGEADDIRELIEKFYQEHSEILNAVFSEDLGNIKKIAEIINPGGNRSYKKGLYFLMMYENRITIKKFGCTPQDMSWSEFIRITEDIFGSMAAGPRTWKNYFGRADDEEIENGEEHDAGDSGNDIDRDMQENDTKPVVEDGRRGADNSGSGGGNGCDNIQPISVDEIDGGADEDNSTENKPEDKKGTVGDHGEVSETGAGKKEDDTAGEKSSESDRQESAAGETTEPAGTESQGEEIAPAQKSVKPAENLEKFHAPTGSQDCDISEINNMNRKVYLDALSEAEAAKYITRKYEENILTLFHIKDCDEMERWLSDEVDENGDEIQR